MFVKPNVTENTEVQNALENQAQTGSAIEVSSVILLIDYFYSLMIEFMQEGKKILKTMKNRCC